MNNNSADGVVIDEEAKRPPLHPTASDLRNLLNVIQDDILPLTCEQVAKGNKVFGAAVLDESFRVVTAGTNEETKCPLFHGEVKVIYDWSQQIPASERGPAAQNSIFLATHEPCCMCISSIVWAGFTKVYYLFPYTDTAAQGIPHDINTMHELWGVNSYRKRNKYVATAGIMEHVQCIPDASERAELEKQIEHLVHEYDVLSKKYHSEKSSNANNSLVLG
jgi:tRNA(Arg) A34 adenosine deaminase TadA